MYLAGQIGTDASDKLVPGGIGPETRQTMENIKAAAEKYGSSMDRVFKCTVFLADVAEWQAFNEVYVTSLRRAAFPPAARWAHRAWHLVPAPRWNASPRWRNRSAELVGQISSDRRPDQ